MKIEVKRLFRVLILFAILGLVFQILAHTGVAEGMQSDLPRWQYYFLPFVFVIFLFLPSGSLRIPRAIIFLSGAAALVGLSGFYGYHAGSTPIVVARFEGDSSASKTKIFQDGLKKALNITRSVPVSRHAKSVLNQDQLPELGAEANILVWGDVHWNFISFLDPPVSLWKDKKLTSPEKIRSVFLEPVHSVPGFGIDPEPPSATFPFLAELFAGLSFPHDQLLSDLDVRATRVAYLTSAATWEGEWNQFAHRAFAYLLLGNDHLFEALDGGLFELGELACAVSYYEDAMALLRPLEAPELRAALYNNKGYALAMQGILLGKSKDLVRAKNHFKAAKNLGYRPDPIGGTRLSAPLAGKNLRRLKKVRKLISGKKSLKLKKRRKDKLALAPS